MSTTILAAFVVAATSAFAADCEALAKLSLPTTSITTAESIAPGQFKPPAGNVVNNLPAFCRVTGVIRPSADSDIQFEVWMPATGWNGKFQGIGNGGFAGNIAYGGLGDAVRNGYAAASTDTGHKGSGIDASWAKGHPEKVADFGYRAIHEMTDKGKAVVQAFYGSAVKRAYFSSCSNGGRQALMEAQRYPADYDGIIAGAPANYWTHLMGGAATNLKATVGDEYVKASKLPAITAAVHAACDEKDGVKDGVLENPAACKFDPAVIQCTGSEADSCLTELQVKAVRKIYAGVRSAKGKLVFPGYSAGGEAEAGGWAAWITGATQEQSALYAFSTQFFKNMVFEDTAWDFRNFEADRDLKLAVDKLGKMLNAVDPDLKRFESRGGKLILYHGWSDAGIPALNIIDYYESVLRKMGTKTSGNFVKLYMVPGMQHCAAGNGPNAFGQGGVAQGDAGSNIAAALEQWVEKGVAPDSIVATKYKAGGPASGVARTRPLCAYPKVARYKGSGSSDEAANFDCVAPGGK